MDEIDKENIKKEIDYVAAILKVTVFAFLPIGLVFLFLGTEIIQIVYNLLGIKLGNQELKYSYIFLCLLISGIYLLPKKPKQNT